MKPYSPEPLTAEERELARLTARLGPQGEPSPALDARILAAAHAAVERPRAVKPKPRWPVAMGLAASVVFAVGIAWQLRPLQQMPTVAAEAPAASAPAAPTAVADEDAGLAGDGSAEAVADAKVQAPPPEVLVVDPPPQARVADSKQMAPRAASRPEAPPPQRALRAQAPAAVAAPPPLAMPSVSPADRYSPPPPPAPPAPVASVAAEDEVPMAFSAEAAPMAEVSRSTAAPAGNVAIGTTTASNSAGISGGSQGSAQQRRESPREARAKAARAQAAEKSEADTLDRVEVTGSRLKRTDLQVPVSDDARLPVNEWLERVRTRYGLGDEGAAKQSLLLFVKDHPTEPVPDDLEPLLEK